MSRRLLLVLTVVLGFAAISARAQVLKWSAGGLGLNTQNSNQLLLATAPTGQGKVTFAWTDARTSPASVYFSFADQVGAAPPAGFVAAQAAPTQATPGIAGDWADGCFVAWLDTNNQHNDIDVQHFNSSGTPMWNAGQNVQLTNTPEDESNPMAFTGPNRTAYFVYNITNPATGLDLVAQRVDQNGNPLWQPNGTPICTAGGDQQLVAVVPNSSGGLILVWNDARNPTVAIYAQSIDSNGATLWATNGVHVSSGAQQPGGAPAAVSDGVGGIIVTYSVRKTAGDSNIVAQRLNSAGAPQWGSDGTTICDTSGLQVSPVIVSDGADGAIIAWQDRRSGGTDVYAQHVDLNGTVMWKGQGVPVSVAGGEQTDIHMGSDGKSGAVICWSDRRGSNTQIYMQALNANGIPSWKTNGVNAGQSSALQQRPVMLTQGLQGYAFIAWEDSRNAASGVDIFGQRVGYQAGITTSRTLMDFGTQTTHGTTTDTLRIHCSGTDSLRIDAWSFTGPAPDTDSVFVVIRPPLLPFKLGPGEDSIIVIQYKPFQNTPNVDTLLIHCTALGPDSVKAVALFGKGKYPHSQAATNTVNFGGVRIHRTKQQIVYLRNVGTDSARISMHTLLGSNKTEFSDSLTNYRVIGPNRDSMPIVLTCTPEKLGAQSAQLQLIINDSTSPYTIALQGTGIFPKTTLTRAGLTFGKVRLNTGKQLVVGVVNAGTDTLHVDSILLSDDPLHFKFTPAAGSFPQSVKPKDTLKLTVTFTPDSLITSRGTMQIFTDDTSGFYQVNLVGQGSFASLELQQSLEFGPVLAPLSPDSAIVIRYAGTDSVAVKGYAISGPDSQKFTVSGITFPFTVTSGVTKIVHVRYAPDTAKRDLATLTFFVQYAGGGLDTLPVQLSGGPTSGIFDGGSIPAGVTLDPSYPNPIVHASGAAELATIVVHADHAISNADVTVINADGQRVLSLFHGNLESGSRAFRFAVSSLPAGAYICTLQTREGAVSQRFTVVR